MHGLWANDFIAKFGDELKRLIKVLLVLALVAATAGVTFCVTYQELTAMYAPSPAEAKAEEVEAYLRTYFIDDYSDTALADGAAAGMIAAAGDEWSYYISAENYAQYLEQMNNAYVGVGVTIRANESEKGFEIMSVTAGGPADVAGVLVGDILVSVEGEAVWDLGMDETVSRVRGEAGTEVTMSFLRNGSALELTLVRSNIDKPVASSQMTEDGIFVITIENFDRHCADETLAAIEEALKQGAKGIVFDVRNNPGGLKDEMVQILDRLLPEGPLFRSVDYADREETDMSDEAFVDLPMAVLVNGDSYSAAEFFAAAMQEYGAATIVGTQTYGKGNFQNTFLLSDGSAISISVGKYFTPNGVSLTGVGITPDIEVELDEEQSAKLYYDQLPMEEDPQIAAALKAIR